MHKSRALESVRAKLWTLAIKSAIEMISLFMKPPRGCRGNTGTIVIIIKMD